MFRISLTVLFSVFVGTEKQQLGIVVTKHPYPYYNIHALFLCVFQVYFVEQPPLIV